MVLEEAVLFFKLKGGEFKMLRNYLPTSYKTRWYLEYNPNQSVELFQRNGHRCLPLHLTNVLLLHQACMWLLISTNISLHFFALLTILNYFEFSSRIKCPSPVRLVGLFKFAVTKLHAQWTVSVLTPANLVLPTIYY